MRIKKLRFINYKRVGLNQRQGLLSKLGDLILGFFKKRRSQDNHVKCKDIRNRDLKSMGRSSNTGQNMHCVQTEPNGPIVVMPAHNTHALKQLYPNGKVIESTIKREQSLKIP